MPVETVKQTPGDLFRSRFRQLGHRLWTRVKRITAFRSGNGGGQSASAKAVYRRELKKNPQMTAPRVPLMRVGKNCPEDFPSLWRGPLPEDCRLYDDSDIDEDVIVVDGHTTCCVMMLHYPEKHFLVREVYPDRVLICDYIPDLVAPEMKPKKENKTGST